jgi:retron-type reverse transcriptase
MTGNSSIDISLANVWRSYRAFRKGKKPSKAIIQFEYELLDNIVGLARELQSGTYKHGTYSHMIVNDNKRRDIAVASVRDRIVHRLLYDYLVPIWDKTFIYDAWSCRQNKGLHSAIDRAQFFMRIYSGCWVWRADITKLFDSIDKPKLSELIRRRVSDSKALWLLDEVLDSYCSFEHRRGIPIGNLTSQILANIYLNEFDRFIKHNLKPYAYLRYGDDWLCFAKSEEVLILIRNQAETFLSKELSLDLHKKINLIRPVKRGVSYLGVDLWSKGRRIDNEAVTKMRKSLNLGNISSYKSLTSKHGTAKKVSRFEWKVSELIK